MRGEFFLNFETQDNYDPTNKPTFFYFYANVCGNSTDETNNAQIIFGLNVGSSTEILFNLTTCRDIRSCLSVEEMNILR